MNASVTLANNPNNSLLAFLVSPSGEAEAYTTNGELIEDSSGISVTSELGGQLHVLNPAAGTWTLIVVYAPAVSGTAISEPFAVSMNEDSVPVQAPNVPDSNRTVLTAGKSYTYNLKVRNTGTAPELYFVDPRLSTSTTMNVSPSPLPIPSRIAPRIPFRENGRITSVTMPQRVPPRPSAASRRVQSSSLRNTSSGVSDNSGRVGVGTRKPK